MPLPKTEATRVVECAVDDAIRMTNEWSGKPLPVSATCHRAGRLAVRLSGAAPAVDAAAKTNRRSRAARWRCVLGRRSRTHRCLVRGGARDRGAALADIGQGERAARGPWRRANDRVERRLALARRRRAHRSRARACVGAGHGGHATLYRAPTNRRRVSSAARNPARIASPAEVDVRSRGHPQPRSNLSRFQG